MFVEPEAIKSKPAIKTNPTAIARSSIRRQRTVRYSPNVRDHQSTLSTLLSRNQSRSQGRMRILADRRSLLEDIRRRDQRATSSSSGADETQDHNAVADLAHSEASQRTRLESGRALLRDALSYERPGRRRRATRGGTRPEAQEVQDREIPLGPANSQHLRTSSRSEIVRSPPPGYMPTPPYASGDISDGSSPYVHSPPLGAASLSPRLQPAHRFDHEDELRANFERDEVLTRLAARMRGMSTAAEREYVAGHRAEINRMRDRNPAELSLEYREAEAAYLESVETRLDLMHRMRERDLSELPPLHRMSQPFQAIVRATRGHSRSTVDGLGDRERSISPDDDQWETMLTTIQPDERIPSANSSFTSATASSSSLSSNAASSYGTLVTAPSTSTEVEACPIDISESEEDPIDLIDAHISLAESQANRIEALSQRLSQQQNRDEQVVRRRRMEEREEELQQLETNLRRLERQISEEQPLAAGRRRRDGVRTGRERL